MEMLSLLEIKLSEEAIKYVMYNEFQLNSQTVDIHQNYMKNFQYTT